MPDDTSATPGDRAATPDDSAASRGTVTTLVVNGRAIALDADPDSPLIYALRNDLGLRGVRPGCGIGECGACTVILDGRAIRSCATPLATAAGAHVTTPEGLGTPEAPHAIQRVFLEEQAAQCGYCINGMIMTVAALLDNEGTPTEAEVSEALVEHLCRCGTHVRVLEAIRRVITGDERARTADAQPARGTDAGSASIGACSGTCTDACEAGGALPPSIEKAPDVEAWLRVLPDGQIEALSGKVEIGQGIRTAFAQIIAAQLEVSPAQVVVRSAATDLTPDERYTAGSLSIEEGGTALGMAATGLRRLLVTEASRRLGQPVADLSVADGAVVSKGGERISFAELAAGGVLTGRIERSDRPHWHGASLGASLPRADLAPKLTGAAAYVHDLTLPGMLHARALLPPSYEARLEHVDVESATVLPGVRAVVADGRLLLAIAEREEQAVRAVTRLAQSAIWDDPGLDIDNDVAKTLRSLPSTPYAVTHDPGIDDALAAGTQRRQATYFKPYQAHGAMAPSCAVALDDSEHLTVWTHSQGVYPLRRELATMLGVDESRLIVRHGDGPGCYGHNGADDAAALACLAARAVPGSPVRFQFTVDDEFAWEPYGSAMLADLEASLDASGCVVGWRHRSRTDVHAARPTGAGDRLFAAWLREPARERARPGPHETGSRNAVPFYDLPAVEAVTDYVHGPLRTGSLRSLASYLNIFAIESFMDELAEAAGQDPVAFRLAHLTDVRAREVLEVAAETAGWSGHVGPSGRGQGIAVSRYKGSKAYVAEVVEATVDPETGDIAVERVVVACDAGVVVSPDGLRNQLEGGVLQGLSRAMYEEVRATSGGIASRDWTTYPVLRFGHVPRIEIVLLDRPGYPPLGAGEASTPPVPAALANAIDDAVGIRLRELPLTPERARQRLMDMSEAEMARVRLD